MTVRGCLTATLALSIWLGALALGQRLDRTLDELDALALANPGLAAECARLQATIDLAPALRAEQESRQATLSKSLKILPSPEIATPERLLELLWECTKQSGVHMRCMGCRWMAGAKARPAVGDFGDVYLIWYFDGTFPAILQFLSALERHETFVRINTFDLSATPADERRSHGGPLRLVADISTFRRRDGWTSDERFARGERLRRRD